VNDGCAVAIPGMALAQTNLFLEVGYLDELFIKVPSSYGLKDYRVFVEAPETLCKWNIRPLEAIERFDKLQSALDSFPSLKPLASLGPRTVHYLLLYKIQYERLLTQCAVAIPEAKFGAVKWRSFGIFYRFRPALFQRRISGTTLWDMYDFGREEVLPRWSPFLPAISVQLSNLLDSALFKHIDWNIKNFVFNEPSGRLFYVDQKPTIFTADHGNETNLKGIREIFLV
jgi:hypothetical protein